MDADSIVIRSMRALRGPNLYAYMPVLLVELDVQNYEHCGSDEFAGFPERLVSWLPGLKRHECSPQHPGGFVERLHRGTYFGHIAEHVCLELQSLMGFPVHFGRTRGTGEPGVYRIVIEYKEEKPAEAAFETAVRLVLAAMHDQPFPLGEELRRLQDLADEYGLGPSTGAIVEAARRRDVPVIRLRPTGGLAQLGWGIRQKRIWASETSYTSLIAVDMCQDKSLTNDILSRVGVPVPEGMVADSADEAWGAAQELGLPVVVKPIDGNQGKGVSLNLGGEDEIREAYRICQSYGPQVIVERFIEGHDYRLLVINGKLEAAARRDPPTVTGDGQQTVQQLVDQMNLDPLRQDGHAGYLSRIVVDDAVRLTLNQQGLDLSSVLPAQQIVYLRRNSNLSTGATANDVTDDVHPENVRLAELAAQIMALDVAGVDLVCKDIGVPLGQQGGAIVEVNAAPGLRMHLKPSAGQPRNVAAPVVAMLYPEGVPSRIPVIAVTGTNGKTTVTRLIAHMYMTAHKTVGMATTDGTYLNAERMKAGDCSGPRSAQNILLHPRVEVAVLETARGGIIREGLGFDLCTVGVVTNISRDHLGLGDVKTLEELAQVKQVVIEAVDSDGAAVLNADDPLVAEMAAATDARVIYFGRESHSPIMASHLAQGGWGVYLEGTAIILAMGDNRQELTNLDRVPFTSGGRIQFQVMNALAAVAAAWGGGVNLALIARALSTFTTDTTTVPGRMNVLELCGVQVILDYGHNAAAMAALGQAMEVLGPKNKTLLAVSLPGDRQDADLFATIEATLPWVDEYLIYEEESDRRGRPVGALPELLRQAIPDGVPCESAPDQHHALAQAWQRLQPGDRFVFIATKIDDAMKELHELGEMEHDRTSYLAMPLKNRQSDLHAHRHTA